MQDFEKLGLFYLGKLVDPSTGKLEDELLLYESKNLTTHAVCVGMTGSGKTGLGITILEEAAIDKIPSIIIDPKGDLGNLFLTFPNLTPEEFKPWIDTAEAERNGMNESEYSEFIAKTWKDGLAAWGENEERIRNFRNTVDLAIYTPASNAGIPISILSSFAAPSKDQMLDTNAIREKILSTTSSLLGLLGIDADPIKSSEHILLSSIIQKAWNDGLDLTIESLIQQVQKPPFTKIGALDLETFYPQKDRMVLSISLNNLLASPGFQAWVEGEPLDISELLYTHKGKPKLSIISIAHLTDSERMFFITLLLNEFVSWMRKQSGTSSLRAILYMDEIFGFFPPVATPPSKLPMLTLLKQARAFGVGIILATQNPVDLDYKGLANCGTWFIGKLQTERDKARVLEGLKVTSNGEMDVDSLNNMLALTGKRTFIMRSIYEKDPILFQTRWSLSYLRGPLTLPQIASLTVKTKQPAQNKTETVTTSDKSTKQATKPNVPPGIAEYFVNVGTNQTEVHYVPKVLGMAKMHFVDTKNAIDVWNDLCFVAAIEDDGSNVLWQECSNCPELKSQLTREAIKNSTYSELPAALMQEKNYAQFSKQLSTTLYQNQTLSLFQTTNPTLVSKANESERDFLARVTLELREKRDEAIKKLREKYSAKIAVLTNKIQKAQEKTEQKKQKAGMQKVQTMISFGSTLLGAILGKKVTKSVITETGTSLRRATQMGKDSQDVTSAEGEVQAYQEQLQELQDQMNAEVDASLANQNVENVQVETLSLRPRKSDIVIEKVALLWWSE